MGTQPDVNASTGSLKLTTTLSPNWLATALTRVGAVTSAVTVTVLETLTTLNRFETRRVKTAPLSARVSGWVT